jgi:hydrophobic/amphiphilic exporter-1 (mainly G- bacteria), HAE1 family
MPRKNLRSRVPAGQSFILGMVPLVIARGAGASGQRPLGTAVFGGMIASTLLAVFFVPVFYVVFQGLSDWWKPPNPAEPSLENR